MENDTDFSICDKPLKSVAHICVYHFEKCNRIAQFS